MAVGEELVNPEDKRVYVINVPRCDSETVVVFQGITQVLPAGIDGAILKEDNLYKEDRQEVMRL